jgi:transcriptional regulator with GAF, ATPase, and Fis domain
MRRIFAVLTKIAPSDSTVLLEGETGTGKSLIAEMIHRRSARARRALGIVDCGAISPTLIESELFGHEKGAFTGALTQRIGALEAAQGGTVFLDEIGEVALDLQPKLLRALEERTIKRVGGDKPIQLDVRIVAATNRDLRAEVNQGRFRADLYYRLNVVGLRIPPLRERREDIALLVHHYYRVSVGDDDAVAPAALVATLTHQRWPGNVRELRSAVERAALRLDVEPKANAPAPEDLSFREAKDRVISDWERTYITELVARHDGNLSRAARAARMDRAYLRELWRHYVPRDPDER